MWFGFATFQTKIVVFKMKTLKPERARKLLNFSSNKSFGHALGIRENKLVYEVYRNMDVEAIMAELMKRRKARHTL